MDLESLLSDVNCNVVYLINSNGDIVKHYSKNNDLEEVIKEKIVAFSSIIFDMTNHFFTNFLELGITNINLKSNNENIVLVKHYDYIICLYSGKLINIGVLERSLKKNKIN